MMLPPLGAISAYTFTTEFKSINGIYKLVEMITYNDAVSSGMDFIKNLYTPAGIATSQYTIDSPTYVGSNVLILSPISETTVTNNIYVPVPILLGVPDSTVSCYNNMAIGISLGVFDNQNQLTWIINEINNILKGVLGVQSPAVLYSLSTTYLTNTQYQAIQSQRVASANGYTTMYEQLQNQIAQNQNLQNIINYYENTLIALNTSSTSSTTTSASNTTTTTTT